MNHFDAPEPLLPEIIEGHAVWQSQRPALVGDGRRLNWGEFGATVHRTAMAIAASGILRGDRVAVLMGNSIEMVEVLFGCLRAGVCVVPLNTSVADAAIEAMIKDCGAAAVVVSPEHFARVTKMRLPSVRLKITTGPHSPEWSNTWLSYEAWRSAADPQTPLPRLSADDIANIIYSSGTTGIPKGIVHDHGRRASWARSLALALRYDSRAIALCPLGLYSNISWVTMLCTLVVGGCIVVEQHFEIEHTLATIERERITHMSLVPVVVQRLLESGRMPNAKLDSLRAIMCCGSPLPIELKKRALREFGCDFIELYGLTEGVITTLDPEDAAGREASVGRPLPGTMLRIIDDADQEVPRGEAGEIVSRGHITMAGYYNRPEASAESTWTDPSGQRWLRTGDVGRFDAEGFLYIVDRKKDMIISGGQNIYPTDIESVVLEHPLVAEVAVIGIPSERWGESPFAVVVPRAVPTDPAALTSELHDWVNQRVGKQQRVSGLRLVDSLPRNPNGKILKRELRKEFATAVA